MTDNVNSPVHYTKGDIECIDAIREMLCTGGFEDYCIGNAMKYLWRWRVKNGREDLAKAVWYLRMAQGDDPRDEPFYLRMAQGDDPRKGGA